MCTLPKSPDLRADMLAGLSLIGLLIPEAVAYASLAELPAQAGLIGLFCGLLVYGLLGSSGVAVVSATSSSAVVLAAALVTLAQWSGSGDRVVLAALLVVLAGGWFVLAALLRLGTIADFIAKPVLRGVSLGLAVVITFTQLPKLVGLPAAASDWQAVVKLAQQWSLWQWPSLVMGGLALLILCCWRSRRQPVALWVIVLALLLGLIWPLPSMGVAEVGHIGLSGSLPDWSVLADVNWFVLLQLSFALAMMIYAESYSSIHTYALRRGVVTAPNRDLWALGLSNVSSGLAGGLPVGAGFSATGANAVAGAQSKWATWTAWLVLMFALLYLLPYVGRIPEAVLAAIVIHAVSKGLSWRPVRPYFRWRRDRLLVLLSFIGVVVLGVLNGLLLAVGMSVVLTLVHFAQPRLSILGRLGEGHDYVAVRRFAAAAPVPRLLILRLDEPLFFANAEPMMKQIQAQTHFVARQQDLAAVVLSMEEVPDLDGTSIEALGQLAWQLHQQGLTLYLCRLHQQAQTVLIQAHLPYLLPDQLNPLSVDDMVQKWQQQQHA